MMYTAMDNNTSEAAKELNEKSVNGYQGRTPLMCAEVLNEQS